MIARRSIEKVVDVFGEVLAILTLALIAFMFINSKFSFLPENLKETLAFIREVAIIAVISLKAIEFSLKRSWILTFTLVAIITVALVFMFMPQSMPRW